MFFISGSLDYDKGIGNKLKKVMLRALESTFKMLVVTQLSDRFRRVNISDSG